MRAVLISAISIPALFVAGPAAGGPVETSTDVQHDVTFSLDFPDDACGPRANTTTYTYNTLQLHETAKADGTFTFHEVIAATYLSDFVDPAIPDSAGRFTEVNNFTVTHGGTVITSTTAHDFLGTVRIFFRLHVTEVKGNPVVEREVFEVTGCP